MRGNRKAEDVQTAWKLLRWLDHDCGAKGCEAGCPVEGMIATLEINEIKEGER